MFKIDNKQNIFLTRGDTAIIDLTLKQPFPPYEEYTLQEGDIVKFTVRKCVKNPEEEIVIEKTFADNQIIINPEDTNNLDYGEYVFDVQLTFAEGAINTVIPYTVGCMPKFIITGEVS